MKDTKKQILEAAVAEFAENGYKRTTVRAICARAKVNVASVNYHFFSKQTLYLQVFETYLPKKDELELPKCDGVYTLEDLNSAIRIIVRTLLNRALDTKQETIKLFLQIAAHEMIASSEMRPILFEKFVSPDINAMKTIFANTNLDEVETYVKILSLMSKCSFYCSRKSAIDKITGDDKFLKNNLDKIVELIALETMVGIDSVKPKEKIE